jgi:hypothetical protein
MSGALDSHRQAALLVFAQTGLLASLDLTKLIYVALQGLEILVVKIRYVCLVLKNLSHDALLSVEQKLA